MTFINRHLPKSFGQYLSISMATLFVSACGSSSSDDSSAGYLKFYNASQNSPAIFVTIDEDIETSEADEVEITYSPIEYGFGSSNSQITSQNYTIELAWQDEDSSARSELEMIYQDGITITDDVIQFVVMAGDVQAPRVLEFPIPIVDDDDDSTYDRFNFRVLNMHPSVESVDLYMSESDESFNEAQLVLTASGEVLTDNIKQDQGNYIVYLTAPGSQEVLFESSEMEFAYASQYIFVIRENNGAGNSPFIVDRLSNSSTLAYIDQDAQAQISVYNAIAEHELLADYTGEIDVFINGTDQDPQFSSLGFGQSSDSIVLENGDYSLDVKSSGQDTSLLKNHLLSLSENVSKSLFLYADEVAVDDDGDGDVDENGDGIIDTLEVNVHSLVVENSSRDSIYDHQIDLVNLIDSDEFSLVTVYFVRSNETIETATYKRSVPFPGHDNLVLNNNTYQVYVVAKENSSDIILSTLELVLSEDASNLFLVLENDPFSSTGYRTTVVEHPTATQE